METFAHAGANIHACARTPSPEFEHHCEQLAGGAGVKISPRYFDLGDAAASAAAAKALLAQDRHAEILVNNAGVAAGALFHMTTLSSLRQVFEVNFFSTLAFTQLISRNMTRLARGSIINIGSIAGLHPSPGMLAYGASKAALMYATSVLAAELGPFNVRVNAIAPGLTQTDMYEQMEAKARERLIASGAFKRPAAPLDIANAALYLASDLSSFVTGHTLRVDGGQG